ncbi:MAG: retropepsin-like aspartic protease [Candidatus Omnitrophota bacterium]
MNIKPIIVVFAGIIFFMPADLRADTIYLDSGETVEGIIKSENEKSVEIDIGFGTVSFSKDKITKVERSTGAETDAITQKWDTRRTGLDKKKETYENERQKRFAEYDQWTKPSAKKTAAGVSKGGEVPIIGEPGSKDMAVSVVINGKVSTTLILDTGANVVTLSRKVGRALGVDLSNTNEIAEFRLAGDRRVKARMVILESVSINGIEVKNVQAGILLDENSGFMLRDGLLGMTFLERFNARIDRKRMKLILDPIQ